MTSGVGDNAGGQFVDNGERMKNKKRAPDNAKCMCGKTLTDDDPCPMPGGKRCPNLVAR